MSCSFGPSTLHVKSLAPNHARIPPIEPSCDLKRDDRQWWVRSIGILWSRLQSAPNYADSGEVTPGAGELDDRVEQRTRPKRSWKR